MAAAAHSLDGKIALITGAARGIGAGTARGLAARGARLALVGLEPEELAKVAAECGPDTIWFEADVTDPAALEEAVAGTVERLGGIDIVMANAGISPVGMVRSIDPPAFERTIEINLLGVWRTVRACLPAVIERHGYVLVVASVAALVHAPGMAPYAASKAGVEAFADSLRSELAHHGVDVGVAYYSWIATDLVAGADEHPVGKALRSRLKGPVGKTFPVSVAATATVEGIARRARWIAVPRWVRGMILLRGALGPLFDRVGRRSAPEAEAILEADARERGVEASSRPVGPGGEAAVAAAEREHA